jgi:hypothetical protein
MPSYLVRYVHKISPSEKDVAGPVELSMADLATKKSLAAALRRARVIQGGDTIRSFRFEDSKIVVFPQASIWHSIILHLPGTEALPPKKTGPDTYRHFTYKPPTSSRGRIMQRFRSSSPITWIEARDRLIAAGIIDPAERGWYLSVAESDYIDERAEALP